MTYPRMHRVRQTFAREREADPRAAVARELQRVSGSLNFKPGARIGITAGSRGIRDIAVIVRALVDGLRAAGAAPFVFPAMGSHGGATADGQTAVLRHYAMTDETLGCPVLSGMETVLLGTSADGIPVFADRYAAEADHVVALNRVKAHTEFKGELESGLAKMLLIGMGKCEGARIYHGAFADHGFDRMVTSILPMVVEKAKVILGLAILENAYEETALIRAVLPGDILAEERGLLRKAKEMAPRLPFDEIDVLIVDEMGKNVSGSGMDTNVLGRFYNHVAREPGKPRIKRIYVRSLTDESDGNATGIGLADFVHQSVVQKMDVAATNKNCITASNPEKARIPIVCESDRAALDVCFATIGLTRPERARAVRIRNTLRLAELQISEAFARQSAATEIEILDGPKPMEFEHLLSPLN